MTIQLIDDHQFLLIFLVLVNNKLVLINNKNNSQLETFDFFLRTTTIRQNDKREFDEINFYRIIDSWSVYIECTGFD